MQQVHNVFVAKSQELRSINLEEMSEEPDEHEHESLTNQNLFKSEQSIIELAMKQKKIKESIDLMNFQQAENYLHEDIEVYIVIIEMVFNFINVVICNNVFFLDFISSSYEFCEMIFMKKSLANMFSQQLTLI